MQTHKPGADDAVTSAFIIHGMEEVRGSNPLSSTADLRSEAPASGGSAKILPKPERQGSGRRIRLPAAVTREVLNSGPCTYCGEDLFPMTVDHVVPVSKGGSNDRANLAPACWPCNREKLNFTPEEWKAWREETGKPWPPQSQTAFLSEVIQKNMPQWRAEKAAEEAAALHADRHQ